MPEVLLRFAQISDTHISDRRIEREDRYRDPAQTPPQFAELIQRLQPMMGQIDAKMDHVFDSARRVVEEINAIPAPLDFVLHSGDVAFDPEDTAEYEPIKPIFAPLHVPIYYLAGNHDVSAFLQQHFSHLPAPQPTFDYELPHEKVHFVCMDSSLHFFNSDQMTWLESRIKSGDSRPLIVALHHNPVLYDEFFGDGVILQNHEAFRALLKAAGERLRGVFYGHMHMAFDTIQDGIPYFCTPSTFAQFNSFPGFDNDQNIDTHSQPGYNVVTLTGDALHVRRINYPI